MSVKHQFSKKLKLLRLAAGFSQEELAIAVNRNKETISHLERGLSFPNAKTMDDLCIAIGVPAREFFSVSISGGERHNTIEEINVELLKLDAERLSICLDQVRALTKNSLP